jgi:hypothetical protein
MTYAMLHADPKVAREWHEEQQAWELTLADGLEIM